MLEQAQTLEELLPDLACLPSQAEAGAAQHLGVARSDQAHFELPLCKAFGASEV